MCLIRCVDAKLLVAEIHPLALAAKFCVEHAEDDASVLGSEGSFVCIPPGMIALAVNEARKSYRLDVVGSVRCDRGKALLFVHSHTRSRSCATRTFWTNWPKH